ncbi:MAG: site-2 protease family protein [Pirellulales bacterium]
MSDFFGWTLPLGRWGRVHVRMHALFIVVAVFFGYLATLESDQAGAAAGALAIGILLVSVLAHELGHAFAAARVGGTADPIVIGPLGGLGNLDPPREPHAELITILAGPLVSLAILLASLPLLLVSGTSLPGLLSPLEPIGLVHGVWWLVALKLTFWINWLLLVVNLLPAFPLDGARMLRALLWPALDFRGASLVAVRVSKLIALGLCVWAWFAGNDASPALLPPWMPLVMLAILVYFSAAQEGAKGERSDWDEEMFNYDFSQGYTSLERSSEPRPRPLGPVERWLHDRREQRRLRRETQEREEERQVDEILLRLHESGLNGLTAQERALLERVSARYRNRLQN